ncbi:DUF397 domain-containing protein, partial [Streptomyces sp. NPDC059788]|uniref:DUF397 domain-containing protein n=1 Tax=Streptomyces sp. NPDC059788 TaxID=3346948 RepID=UPI00366A1851
MVDSPAAHSGRIRRPRLNGHGPGGRLLDCADDVTWRKSTHSGGQGECLEIADGLPPRSPVPVRDS